MSINKQAKILTDFINDDAGFYSDCYKELHGSRPGRILIQRFMKGSDTERQADLKDLCNSIQNFCDQDEEYYLETVKNLQQYGDFTAEQLSKWDCL